MKPHSFRRFAFAFLASCCAVFGQKPVPPSSLGTQEIQAAVERHLRDNPLFEKGRWYLGHFTLKPGASGEWNVIESMAVAVSFSDRPEHAEAVAYPHSISVDVSPRDAGREKSFEIITRFNTFEGFAPEEDGTLRPISAQRMTRSQVSFPVNADFLFLGGGASGSSYADKDGTFHENKRYFSNYLVRGQYAPPEKAPPRETPPQARAFAEKLFAAIATGDREAVARALLPMTPEDEAYAPFFQWCEGMWALTQNGKLPLVLGGVGSATGGDKDPIFMTVGVHEGHRGTHSRCKLEWRDGRWTVAPPPKEPFGPPFSIESRPLR